VLIFFISSQARWYTGLFFFDNNQIPKPLAKRFFLWDLKDISYLNRIIQSFFSKKNYFYSDGLQTFFFAIFSFILLFDNKLEPVFSSLPFHSGRLQIWFSHLWKFSCRFCFANNDSTIIIIYCFYCYRTFVEKEQKVYGMGNRQLPPFPSKFVQTMSVKSRGKLDQA